MRRWIGIGILCLAVALGLGAVAAWRLSAGASQEDERPARRVAPLFDPGRTDLLEEPDRDRWQKPDELVRLLNLRPGERVADLGAGSGYLERRLSRAVGPTGVVYAEEIQDAFLPELRRRAAYLGNVQVVWGTAPDPQLPSREIDCFVLLTVYHEVRRPVPFLKTLRRYARRGARLAIIDFDAGRHGSPPAPADHWVSEADVIREAKEAGWRLAERHDLISSQFFLQFRMD